MGRIQSSIGLVTGTDIAGTVDKLISLSGRPRDRLVNKGKEIQGQQQQIASLTATVIGVQLAGDSLGSVSLFRSKSATSSNDAALSVRPSENAVDGTYTVQTLQTAATHNVQSAQRFAQQDEALGLSGKLTINPSGFVDKQVSLAALNDGLNLQSVTLESKLADLNQGSGIGKGSFAITDSAGNTGAINIIQLERNGERVESMNVRLEAQRERLLKNYYAMEQAIGKIQSNSQYASNISYIRFE